MVHPDVPSKASGDRMHFPSVEAPRDWSHKVAEWLQFVKDSFSGELSDSDSVAVEQPPKRERTLKYEGEFGRRVNRSFLSQHGSRDQAQASQLAGTVFLTHVPKDPDCKVCELTKTTTNSVQEAVVSTVRSWSSSTKVDDATTADHTVLSSQ